MPVINDLKTGNRQKKLFKKNAIASFLYETTGSYMMVIPPKSFTSRIASFPSQAYHKTNLDLTFV